MDPLCRLCLQDGPALRPVHNDALQEEISFNTGESTEQSLVQLILQYLPIQIIKAECKESPYICTKCRTSIEEWHRFHNACLKNDVIYQRRLAEMSENVVHNPDHEISQPLFSIEYKQEELEISDEDAVDDDMDPDYEQPLDEDRLEEYPSQEADDGQEDVGSECATSEHELVEKAQPTKKRKNPKSATRVIVPKKRGKPKGKEEEELEDLREMMREHDEKVRSLYGNKNGKRTEVCTICGKFLKNLTEHMRIHNNEKRHQCPYCPKAFVSASNYCSHVNIHTRAKMYKCDLCDKEYAMLNSLKEHRVTHTKERIYLCPVCGKAYYQMTGLARHKRTHFEEPKIKCSECGKMFLTGSDLRKHFSKHLPKPFTCEICNRAFSRKDNLRTHMKVHQKTKPVETVATEEPGPTAPESVISIKAESPKVVDQ